MTLIDDALMTTISILSNEAGTAGDTPHDPDHSAMRERITDGFEGFSNDTFVLDEAITATVFTVVTAVAGAWWRATEAQQGCDGYGITSLLLGQLPTTDDGAWAIITTAARVARDEPESRLPLAMWAYIQHLSIGTYADVCLFVAAQTIVSAPRREGQTRREAAHEMIIRLIDQYDKLRDIAAATFLAIGGTPAQLVETRPAS